MRCAGNEELQPPNLDRLTSTGVRFDNFFCASPVCSPARASILTGQIPSQHGVQDFLREDNHPNLPNDGREIQYLVGKKASVTVLAANGYDCALSGKWHPGKSTLPPAGFRLLERPWSSTRSSKRKNGMSPMSSLTMRSYTLKLLSTQTTLFV